MRQWERLVELLSVAGETDIKFLDARVSTAQQAVVANAAFISGNLAIMSNAWHRDELP